MYLFEACVAAALESVPLPGILLPQGLDLGSGTGRWEVADGDLIALPDRPNCNQVLNT